MLLEIFKSTFSSPIKRSIVVAMPFCGVLSLLSAYLVAIRLELNADRLWFDWQPSDGRQFTELLLGLLRLYIPTWLFIEAPFFLTKLAGQIKKKGIK